MTTHIIPQRHPRVALPPQLRRGRHAIATHPHTITLISQRVATRFTEANLHTVRDRTTRWSVIAIPAACYLAIAVNAILGGAS